MNRTCHPIARLVTGASLALIVLLTAQVRANSVLTMDLSSPDNLANLTVGQTFTINVSLGALAPGERLQSLTGAVEFPAAMLGTPQLIAAGAIVPNPLADPLDFQSVNAPGQADAIFVTFSPNASEQITANGVFYSFTLKALAVGSGQISLNGLGLIGEQFVPGDVPVSILRPIQPGAPLSFTISSSGGPGPNPVPLPAAAWGGLALIGGFVAQRWWLRRV